MSAVRAGEFVTSTSEVTELNTGTGGYPTIVSIGALAVLRDRADNVEAVPYFDRPTCHTGLAIAEMGQPLADDDSREAATTTSSPTLLGIPYDLLSM